MQSSDTSWHAYKYLWDLGDGRPTYTILATDSTYFSYSTPGFYHVTALAMDSLDNVLTQAHALALIGLPQAKMVLAPHALLDTSTNPIVFRATVTPYSVLEYHWDFGDGTGPINTYQGDSASHQYFQNGTYHVVATAYYRGYLVCSDTATVIVQLPATTLTALSSMAEVTSRINFLDGTSFEFTLPLKNSGENTFRVTGRTMQADFLHKGLDSNAVRKFDTTYYHLISGTLGANGTWLTVTNSYFLDSRIWDSCHADPCVGTDHNTSEYQLLYHFPADSLALVQATADSIVFTCPMARTETADYSNYSDSSTWNSSNFSVGSHGYLAKPGVVSIVFRR